MRNYFREQKGHSLVLAILFDKELSELEVIGNIHENKELLNEAEK